MPTVGALVVSQPPHGLPWAVSRMLPRTLKLTVGSTLPRPLALTEADGDLCAYIHCTHTILDLDLTGLLGEIDGLRPFDLPRETLVPVHLPISAVTAQVKGSVQNLIPGETGILTLHCARRCK